MGGVVDPNLKVYGTKNLRVVDASIMPFHIAAQIQATVYAISEKVSKSITQLSVYSIICTGLRVLTAGCRDSPVGGRCWTKRGGDATAG